MNYYRVNLNKSYHAFKKHLKITCPAEGHAGWSKMIQIKQGDIVLTSRGLTPIETICVAIKDAYVGNISYFSNYPELCSNSFITLELKILQECEITASVVNSFLTKDSLLSNNFCVQLYPNDIAKFHNYMNAIISNQPNAIIDSILEQL